MKTKKRLTNWKKRILSVLLALLTVGAMMPALFIPASAETAFSGAVAGSSPSLTYTLTYTRSRPNNTQMKYDFTLKATMSNDGYLKNGALNGKVTVGGVSKDITIKSFSSSWYQSSTPTKTYTFSITCASTSGNASQSGKFVVTSPDFSSSGLINKPFTITSLALLTYKVSYNANGGSVSPANATANIGSSVTTPTPTKKYTLTYNVNGGLPVIPTSKELSCRCTGWFAAASGGSSLVQPGANYNPGKDITVFAQWVNPTMGALETPNHPTSGFTFKGWFTAPSGGTQVTSSTTMTGNQTIYAQWNDPSAFLNRVTTLDCTVSENKITNYMMRIERTDTCPLVTGFGFNVYKYDGSDFNILYDAPYIENPAGYQAADWTWPITTVLENGTYIIKAFIIDVNGLRTEAETRYGWFEIDGYEYTINYNATGGDVTPTNEVVIYGKSTTTPVPSKEYILMYDENGGNEDTDDKSLSCVCTGWFTASSGGTKRANAGAYYVPAQSDIKTETFYAQWTNPAMGVLPTLTREGYTFKGWFTAASGGTQVTSGTVMTADQTIYAQWTPITYTIVYDPNGGTGTTPSSTHTYDVAKKLERNVFYKPDHTFTGWSTLDESIVFDDEQSVVNLEDMSGATITLKAIWTANPTYQISYDANSGSVATPDATVETGASVKTPKPEKNYALSYDVNGGDIEISASSIPVICDGWFTAPSGGSKRADAAESYTPTQSETIYAHWMDPAMGGLPTTTRTGYIFIGWFTARSGGTQVTEDTIMTDDRTIYAQWTPITYTVSYDANGGSGVTASSTHTYAAAKALTPNGFYNTGKNFIGWAESSDGALVYYDEQSVSNLSDIDGDNVMLYAVWTPKPTYTITYNDEGNTLSATVEVGESLTTLTPAKSFSLTYETNGGNAISPTSKSLPRTCNGWFTAPSGGTKRADAGESYTPGQSETIYAQWTNPVAGDLPTPTHPQDGYTFKGWFTAASGGTQVTSSTTMTGNQTIYAQWNVPYTITYNANGGSVSPPSAVVAIGNSVTTPTPTMNFTLTYNANGGNTLSPSSKNVVRTCNGWFTAASGGSKRANAGASFTPAQSETIYAQWANPTMGVLPTPTHPSGGYAFKGWFTAATGGVQVTENTIMSGNQTIYAQWAANTYTITYNGNGNTGGSTPSSNHTYDTPKELTQNGFIKTGYTFVGWATSASGNVEYSDKQSVSNLTVVSGGAVPLYAQWKKIVQIFPFSNKTDMPDTYAISDSL
jgi:uncharacterized repeat protein (TIGR02543 family)